MRNVRFLMGLFWVLLPSFVHAQAPCPESEREGGETLAPNALLDGGCTTNLLEEFAPVRFEFSDDKPAAKGGTPASQEAPQAWREDAHSAKGRAVLAPADGALEAPRLSPPKNARPLPTTCTYSAYVWDTRKGRSSHPFEVRKAYAEVTDEERDAHAPMCTICREDQVEIDPSVLGISHAPIRICHAYAEAVTEALRSIAASGQFDVQQLEGYRPGKTRGPVDASGFRTLWSQHSFGTALDINSKSNAIYARCPKKLTRDAAEVRDCKRGIGGAWNPQKAPRVSITKPGVVYDAMTRFWKWGGEIEGNTKDIMHFSVTGY